MDDQPWISKYCKDITPPSAEYPFRRIRFVGWFVTLPLVAGHFIFNVILPQTFESHFLQTVLPESVGVTFIFMMMGICMVQVDLIVIIVPGVWVSFLSGESLRVWLSIWLFGLCLVGLILGMGCMSILGGPAWVILSVMAMLMAQGFTLVGTLWLLRMVGYRLVRHHVNGSRSDQRQLFLNRS